jgi:hypothetical protein
MRDQIDLRSQARERSAGAFQPHLRTPGTPGSHWYKIMELTRPAKQRGYYMTILINHETEQLVKEELQKRPLPLGG